MKHCLFRLGAAVVVATSLLTVVGQVQPAAATTNGCSAIPWPPDWYNSTAKTPQGSSETMCDRTMQWVRADAVLQQYGLVGWESMATASDVETNSTWAYAVAVGSSCYGQEIQQFRSAGKGSAQWDYGYMVNDPPSGSTYYASNAYNRDCGKKPTIDPIRPF